MSLYRVALAAGAVLLATVFSSASFAGCCGGCGGCGGAYVVGYTYAPAIPVAPPVAYAPAPVAPLPIAPAPIAADHWDTGGWGGGWGGGWNGGGNGWGGCGCCCNRGLFTSGYFGSPAVAPIYVVNQGPQYSGPGIMLPYLPYSPGAGYAAPGAYPYIGRYPYRPYYQGYYAHRVHHYYWHHRYPLRSRG